MMTLEDLQRFMKSHEDELGRGGRLILIAGELDISFESVPEIRSKGGEVLPSSSVLGAWQALQRSPQSGYMK